MASVTVSTHTFKSVNGLDLKVDLFQKTSEIGTFDSSNPVVLFLHGGGFVGFNRKHVPPHVVQSSLRRGWPLVSADYRLLPQVKGIDLLEDITDAYKFVRQKLPAILGGEKEGKAGPVTIDNIILVGQSAGAYLSFMGGLYFDPQPTAILSYYGFATVDEPYFSKPREPSNPVPISTIQCLLDEPVNTSMTPPFNLFDPACLLPDLSRNPTYVRPKVDYDNPADRRMILVKWMIEEHGFQHWFKGVDKSLSDESWRHFPETVLVHGDADRTTPINGSKKLLDVIGPVAPRLFVAHGQGHSFDQPFYLGDKDLLPVEKAWSALEDIVTIKLA